jgi:hypothetical protein
VKADDSDDTENLMYLNSGIGKKSILILILTVKLKWGQKVNLNLPLLKLKSQMYI